MTLLCFPSNPLVIQNVLLRIINQFVPCSSETKIFTRSCYICPKLSYCGHTAVWVPWETHSGKVYQERPLGSTTVEDEGISTGRRSGLPWILTKASNDPTGNPGAAMALQSSLKVRWEVKPLYSPSNKSSDSGLLGKCLGVVALDWDVLLIQGQFLERGSVEASSGSLSEYFSPLGGRQHPLWCDRTYLCHLHDSPQNSQLWYVGCLHLVRAKMIAFLLFYCFFKLWGYIYILTAYPSEVGNIVHSSVVILLQLLYLRQN